MKAICTILKAGMVIISVILFVMVAGVMMLSRRDRAVVMQPQKTLFVDGTERHYLISVSPKSRPTKLVVGLHGFGDSPHKFAYYTALHNVAGDDTIVVYPSATRPRTKNVKSGWNSGFCCGSGWIDGVDDVGFIQELIDKVSREYGISAKDTFLVGFSNGAFMAQRFAVDRPNSIGGVAISSGTIGTTTDRLRPRTPVPILIMHGELDKTVPMLGGSTASDPDFDWLPYAETLSVWRKNDGEKATVSTIIFHNTAHIWYGWRIANLWHHRPQASVESINFLKGL